MQVKWYQEIIVRKEFIIKGNSLLIVSCLANRTGAIGNAKYKTQEDYYDEIQSLKKVLWI